MPRPTTGSLAALVAVLAACTGPSAPPPGAAAPTPAVAAAAMYNEAQASRGQEVFRATCVDCHYSSEFRDAEFQFKWGRRTAWDLFRNIRANMPDDDPGGLPTQNYVDVVVYILQLNGFPGGGPELAAEENALAAYTLAAPKANRSGDSR